MMRIENQKQFYKSVKLPKWIYDNSKQVALTLSRKGIDNLPKEVLSPDFCPTCKSQMEKLELKYSYKKCPHCGYMQQDFTASSNFLKGALVGGGIALGLSLLLYYLHSTNPKENKKVAT